MNGHALFLSYNSVDRPCVVAVQKLLGARGITTFLDRDQLVPGLPWPAALEEGLRCVRAVADFIGQIAHAHQIVGRAGEGKESSAPCTLRDKREKVRAFHPPLARERG
jgi:TIR domain